MTHSDGGHELSPAVQTYLLTLRSIDGADEVARAASLARRLGVSAQSVSEMVARLVADALVAVRGNHELHLTQAGRLEADIIFRRHCLLEWLLTGVVGLGWAESDEEAGRLQGALSMRVEARLSDLLGNPQTCPHGNPINADATRDRPRGIPLSEADRGGEITILRITEEAEEDIELLSYLEEHRLVPGTVVRVTDMSAARDSITLDGPVGLSSMGLRPASLIRVLPGRADPALFHKLPQIPRP